MSARILGRPCQYARLAFVAAVVDIERRQIFQQLFSRVLHRQLCPTKAALQTNRLFSSVFQTVERLHERNLRAGVASPNADTQGTDQQRQ
jgi:hypothetical protein